MENQLRLQINSQRAAMIIAALEKLTFTDETKKLGLEDSLYNIMMEDYFSEPTKAPKSNLRDLNTIQTTEQDDRI